MRRSSFLIVTLFMSDDLIEVDKVLPDEIEKACYLKHRSYHQWYSMSNQTKEDLALFKTWDSERNGAIAGMLSCDECGYPNAYLLYQVSHLMTRLCNFRTEIPRSRRKALKLG